MDCKGHAAGAVTKRELCISIVPIFNHLDLFELKEIIKSTYSAAYPRGETIYRAGDSSEGLYIVRNGRMKVFRLSNGGREQLVRILGPGEFTGELSLFTESVHEAYAEAIEPAELCVMGRKSFQELLLSYPNISIKMLSEFSARLSDAEKKAASIATERVKTRLAKYLAGLAKLQESNIINLPMTRRDLASYLGSTPETVSRRLSEFEEHGWIKQKSQRMITIKDLDALLLV